MKYFSTASLILAFILTAGGLISARAPNSEQAPPALLVIVLGLAAAILSARTRGAVPAEPPAEPRAQLSAEPDAPLPTGLLRLLRSRPLFALAGFTALLLTLYLKYLERSFGLQLAGWAVFLVAWEFAYVERRRNTNPSEPDWPIPRTELALILALLGIALAACVIGLNLAPGGLYGDEAEFGTLAIGTLAGRPLPPFANGLAETPALFTWIQAAFMGLARNHGMVGIRLGGAIAGAMCFLPAYTLLRRELGPWLAATAAALVVLSPLHLHLSRIGIIEAWMPPLLMLTLSALYYGLRYGRPGSFVTAGTGLALCFYAGSKGVLVPPILFGAGCTFLVATKAKPPWSLLCLMILSAFLVFAPQAIQYSRTGWLEPLWSHSARWVGQDASSSLTRQVVQVARLFIDGQELSPFSATPFLNWILTVGESTLFVIGLGVCLARLRQPLCAFLVGWLVVGLASLVVDQRPNQVHHLVAIADLPGLFAGFALYELKTEIGTWSPSKWLGTVAAAIVALGVAGHGLRDYFVENQTRWQGADVTALGRAMRLLAPKHHLVLVTLPMSWDINSVLRFEAPNILAEDKLTALDPEVRWFNPRGRDVAFIISPQQADLIRVIRSRYPAGRLSEWRGPGGDLRVTIYRVAAAEVTTREGSLRQGAPQGSP